MIKKKISGTTRRGVLTPGGGSTLQRECLRSEVCRVQRGRGRAKEQILKRVTDPEGGWGRKVQMKSVE